MKVAIFLSFQSNVVTGVYKHASKDFVYAVENELLFDFQLRVPVLTSASDPLAKKFQSTRVLRKPGSRIGQLTGPGGADIRAPQTGYDTALRAYIPDPVSDDVIRGMIEAHNQGIKDLKLDIRLWWKSFFKHMLKFLTRTTGDTFNLARPDAEKPILDGFKHKPKDDHSADIDYLDNPMTEQFEFVNIPCELTSIEPKTPTTDVKLAIRMRLDQLPAADHDEVARSLIAADWTKLYQIARSGKLAGGTDPLRPTPWYQSANNTPTTDVEKSLKTWETNIGRYLLNHTDLTRGEKIRDEILNRAVANVGNPVLQLVQKIRDDIDARIITANHWADNREDLKNERYQKLLSDLFGETHQNRLYASPVRFLRVIDGSMRIGDLINTAASDQQGAILGFREKFLPKEELALILQYGVGHCGEHATVSYEIVKELMSRGHAAKFGNNVIYTGNANVDHAFVLGGFRVTNIILTTNQFDFSPGGIGEKRTLLDLEAHLLANRGSTVWVLDPYLAPTSTAQTGDALLQRVNSPKRANKATNFLNFNKQTEPVAPTQQSRTKVKGV